MTTPRPVARPPHNNAYTPGGRLAQGITGKGWLPGQSGNPAGRPPALVNQIHNRTNNGQRLVSLLLDIVDGKGRPKPRAADRIDAARLLMDRGWGRPVQTTEISGPGGGPIQSQGIYAELDTETLHRLVELRDQVLALSIPAALPAMSESEEPDVAEEADNGRPEH